MVMRRDGSNRWARNNNWQFVNRHSTVTHYQRPNMTHPQEGGTGGEVSEILFFSAKSKRRPSLIYSMQIIPVCLSIVARRKGVSATRRGGLNCNLAPLGCIESARQFCLLTASGKHRRGHCIKVTLLSGSREHCRNIFLGREASGYDWRSSPKKQIKIIPENWEVRNR